MILVSPTVFGDGFIAQKKVIIITSAAVPTNIVEHFRVQGFEEIPMEDITIMKGVHCDFIFDPKTSISFVEVRALFHSAKMGKCCWV